jgi:hypothetical protein
MHKRKRGACPLACSAKDTSACSANTYDSSLDKCSSFIYWLYSNIMGVQGLERFVQGAFESAGTKAIVVDFDNIVHKLWEEMRIKLLRGGSPPLEDHDQLQLIYRQQFVLERLWEELQTVRNEFGRGRSIVYVSKLRKLLLSAVALVQDSSLDMVEDGTAGSDDDWLYNQESRGVRRGRQREAAAARWLQKDKTLRNAHGFELGPMSFVVLLAYRLKSNSKSQESQDQIVVNFVCSIPAFSLSGN